MNIRIPLCVTASAIFLTACATNNPYQAEVDNINQRYITMESDTEIKEFAPVELERTRESITKLNQLIEQDAKPDAISHQMYMVERHFDITEASTQLSEAESVVENAELKRKDVLLQAQQQKLDQSQQEAQQASQLAQEMKNRAAELENQVNNLKTKETDRGLVLTLDDILFSFDSTELKPGAERNLQEVAGFLNNYPNRAIKIEGYTDSTGASDYNQTLSKQRAESVKDMLVRNGIAPSRVQIKGYGEEYPVATNDTKAGRQENRRVEIIVSESENTPVEDRSDSSASS